MYQQNRRQIENTWTDSKQRLHKRNIKNDSTQTTNGLTTQRQNIGGQHTGMLSLMIICQTRGMC